ncbi:TPA: hypothetical protein ACFP4P_000459 [Neisseria subflava]
MAKIYIANTALILEDEAGKQFRVEAGEAIELTPEQYESVAAHVTPTTTTGEELDAQQAEAQEKTPSESTATEDPESQTKTQRKTKADA